MGGPVSASAKPQPKTGSRSSSQAKAMSQATEKAKACPAPPRAGSKPSAKPAPAHQPPRLAQGGLPLPLPLTPPAPQPQAPKGILERAREAIGKAGQRFQQDIQQEIRTNVAIINALPAATSITYEHKIGVVKQDYTLLGTGVTVETGSRWSASYRFDGKAQTGVKRYASAAVTVTFPKTKILGGGPYIEGKGEIAGTGDISVKGWPPQFNSANVDARLIAKGAAGIQGSLFGQSAKLYFQPQGGVRAGVGVNRPFDLAPETVGTYIVGEAGNHVLKLKVPFYEMMQIQPQVVATRLALKAGQRLGEAIGSLWQSDPKPIARPAAPPQTPAPAKPCWQPPTTHVVKSGDTLWDITNAHSGGRWTWQQLAKANADQVKNPDLIYPGQVLRFPTK